MKQEAFLIVGIKTILKMAFILGGKKESCAQRLVSSTQQEYKLRSIEMEKQKTDTLTTKY